MAVSFHPSLTKKPRRHYICSNGGSMRFNTWPEHAIAAAKAKALNALKQCEYEPKLTVLEKAFYDRLKAQAS